MATVRTPVKGFTGVVVGVSFVDGAGECEDSMKLSYFQRHGYSIGDPKPEAEPAAEEKPKKAAK